MQHYYKDVPGLGNIAVSRHAQHRMEVQSITEQEFQDALLRGSDVPDSADVVWRESSHVRIVILTKPTPYSGAKLVKTVFRIQAQARI